MVEVQRVSGEGREGLAKTFWCYGKFVVVRKTKSGFLSPVGRLCVTIPEVYDGGKIVTIRWRMDLGEGREQD